MLGLNRIIFCGIFRRTLILSVGPGKCSVLEHFDFVKSHLFLLLLVLPTILVIEPQLLHTLIFHKIVFHAAILIVNLELSASFGHELMLGDTFAVGLCLFIALMEMVQWEGPLIRRLDDLSIEIHCLLRILIWIIIAHCNFSIIAHNKIQN
jgi:hypothetical protein